MHTTQKKEVVFNLTSVIEAVIDVMKTFIEVPSGTNGQQEQQPKLPLHLGEALTCWTFLTMLEEEIAIIRIGVNTTGDSELLEALHAAMGLAQAQAVEMREFMLREGVPLPHATEIKPKSEPDAIPLGVKLTDSEIANALAMKAAADYMTCASGAVQSIRTDVGMMFVKFQAEKLKFGASLKNVNA